LGEVEKQIPFGDDNQKSAGKGKGNNNGIGMATARVAG
jgi:hypothetical protein